MKTEKYAFIYRSGPNWHRSKCIIKRFRNQSEADAFAEGLRRSGAMDVTYTLERRSA